MDGLLNSLDFWLMVFTIGAGIYYFLWKDRIQPLAERLATFLQGAIEWGAPVADDAPAAPRRPPSTVRSRPLRRRVPIRRADGKLAGSRSIVPPDGNGAEGVPAIVPAPGAAVPDDNEVPIVPISVPEIVQITLKLSQGMAPSDVAKTLPGYSARNYQEYMTKVRQVKATVEAQRQEVADVPSR